MSTQVLSLNPGTFWLAHACGWARLSQAKFLTRKGFVEGPKPADLASPTEMDADQRKDLHHGQHSAHQPSGSPDRNAYPQAGRAGFRGDRKPGCHDEILVQQGKRKARRGHGGQLGMGTLRRSEERRVGKE